MTILQSLVALALLLGCSVDARAEAPSPAVAPQPAAAASVAKEEHRQVVIPVEGMGCESCAERLQSKLARLDGVTKATVDFSKKEARVTFDPHKITTKQIVAEINKHFEAGKPKTEGAA
jgi:copper chaperone CopZ